MPKTLAEAKRKARQLQKMHPNMKVRIIDHTKTLPRESPFRYNFRFKKK